MRAQINGVFCGDDTVTYEGKQYRRFYVFSLDDSGLYKIAVPASYSIDNMADYVGQRCSIVAELRTFDGRNRLKLISIEFA